MDDGLRLIGKRIREIRIQRGLTQEIMAEKADVSIAHYSDIERGVTNFSVRILIRIAETLNVSTDELLRPDTHNTSAMFSRELLHILDSCTSKEQEHIKKALLEIKQAIVVSKDRTSI